ncbi:hypothetical protein [Streptomyces sp. NPDC002619]|uniref:hypothetical protein n=1 Tax=Streptomyces sp. NPDC002619 TaxID=3364655 RepID=UPI00367BD3B9
MWIRLYVGAVFLCEGILKFLRPVALGTGRFAKAGVFLAYASSKGRALIDRRLYLPEHSWCQDAVPVPGSPTGWISQPSRPWPGR